MVYEAGLVNTVNMEADRNALFWFLSSGIFLYFLGQITSYHTESTDRPPPFALGLGLFLYGIGGVILSPASGIWLLIPQGWIILSAKRPRIALDKKEFYSQNWKVHEITKDFALLDHWEFPIVVDTGEGFTLSSVFNTIMKKPKKMSFLLVAAAFLSALRVRLGKIFRWDKEMNVLPIPGCTEASLAERMDEALRATVQEKTSGRILRIEDYPFRLVYGTEEEILMELSNNTVHGVLHFARVSVDETRFKIRMSILVKTRGLSGRLYMALIMPFRRFVVYPAMMKQARENFRSRKRKGEVMAYC